MAEGDSISRFWWLKRLAAVFTTVVVGIVVVHLALNWWMGRRVDRLIAEFRQMPVMMPEDTGGPPGALLDPSNPAHHVDKALNLLTPMTVAERAWEDAEADARPPAEVDLQTMAGIVARDRPALDALRAGRDPSVDGPIQWALGPMSLTTLLPHLNLYREMAKRLSWAMDVAYQRGDWAEMEQLNLDSQLLTSSAVEYGPSFVSCLVAVGMSNLNATALLEIASRPEWGGTSRDKARHWRDGQEHIKGMIRVLVDDQGLERMKVASLESEWLHAASLVDPAMAKLNGVPRNVVERPAVDLGIITHLEYVKEVHEVWASADSFQAVAHWLPEPDAIRIPGNVPARLALTYAGMFAEFAGYTRGLLIFYRMQTDNRAAAIALAMRLYQADHDGAMPATLDDLVPQYLPALPADPMKPTGGPFGYTVLAGLPVIYSVGADGIDDGGSVEPDDGPITRFATRDWVYVMRFPEGFDADPTEYLLEQERTAAHQLSR